MTYLYYGARPALVYQPAVDFIAPDDDAFSVSDLAGTFVQDSSKIRLTRSTSDGQGLEHVAPGARVRFAVTLAAPGIVEIDVEWTGLVTRDEIYNAVGQIWVNGSNASQFAGPSKGPSDPHPTGSSTIPVPMTAGSKQVEVIFPYCASMDFKGVRIPASASILPAAARPTLRGVFAGDSITNGFNASKAMASWPFLTALGKVCQVLNHGYGGRGLVPTDGTTIGAYGCDFATYLIGFNDFAENGFNLTTWKNSYKTFLTNFRAASTSAGKSTAPLYCLTPTWAGPDDGLGPYAGNSPTLEQFRQAIRDAVSEQADPYVSIIEGLGTGMPQGADKFLDLVHPNDPAEAEIAAVVLGEIA